MPSPRRARTTTTATPRAAEPQAGQPFDPWNSSSTGHQRAENRLAASTGWRESRNTKLQSQFRGGATGGERMSDTAGAGARDFDARTGALITPEARARARSSVMDMLTRPGSMRKTMAAAAVAGSSSTPSLPSRDLITPANTATTIPTRGNPNNSLRGAEDEAGEAGGPERPERPRKIFDGVVVYVNGSTHPVISDHKLKHVLAEHGARMSSHLGRRQVTHVILGRPAGGGRGAGGGLAGGKLQKEIQRVGGCGVKFVNVEW